MRRSCLLFALVAMLVAAPTARAGVAIAEMATGTGTGTPAGPRSSRPASPARRC